VGVSSPEDDNEGREGEAPENGGENSPSDPGKAGRRMPPAYRLHQHVQQNFLYLRDRAVTHHRFLSAAATILGFLGDNYFFRHADVGEMQLLFVIYLATIAVSILLLHGIEARFAPEKFRRMRAVLPLATQFAFGGLWSALLIFYSHAAVFTASWPFLLLLVVVLIASEIFSHYLPRLVFASVLLFFGLFSSAIFLVPVYVLAIGSWVFILSGALSVLVFLGYLRLLNFAGRDANLRVQKLWISLGVAAVLLLLNGLYFTSVLPPLPLVLRDSGVYHYAKKNGDLYDTKGEERSWWDGVLGRRNVQHVAPNEQLYVYSAIFAPTALRTRIVHRWQFYSPKRKRWLAVNNVSFSVRGGRDGGYRAYSRKLNPRAGEWRVDIGTSEGRLIGRVRFSVERVAAPVTLIDKALK
jgi:hypothetical protein